MSKNILEAIQGISGETKSRNLVEAIDKIAEGGGSSGGGGEIFVVNAINNDPASTSFTSDKAYSEIMQAMNSGKICILMASAYASEGGQLLGFTCSPICFGSGVFTADGQPGSNNIFGMTPDNPNEFEHRRS